MGWRQDLQLSPETIYKLRCEDIRRAQKRRRARNRRIDYQNVSNEAGAAIDTMRSNLKQASEPSAFSDAINVIIADWLVRNEGADELCRRYRRA
jgi:hypothetical protein